MPTPNDYCLIISEECRLQGFLNPGLAIAIANVESALNPKAARFEKGWAYYYQDAEMAKIQKLSIDTERAFQKTSWGLMQIMGGMARRMGYLGFLPDLTDPGLGCRYAIKLLQYLVKRFPKLDDAVSAYNAGYPRKKDDGQYQNQSYVNKVLDHLSTVR